MTTVENRQKLLREICQSLKIADENIVDIIQFGSSVYAPDLARDVDVLITTRVKKDEDLYIDAFLEVDIGVDVIVRTPGQFMGEGIAASVLLLGEVLLGNGQTLKEAEVFMAAPTFERARLSLESADEILTLTKKKKKELLKDEFYCAAFNRLFDAARSAVTAYLNTENSRWGQLKKALPKPFDEQFRKIVLTLHIQYSYDGNYPKDRADEEFKKWRKEVVDFIDKLETASTRS